MSTQLKRLMEKVGIKNTELARRVGTSRVQIGRLIKGERNLTKEWAVRLAPHLRCTPIELLDLEGQHHADGLLPVESSTSATTGEWSPAAVRFADSDSYYLSIRKVAESMGVSRDEVVSLLGLTLGAEARSVDAALSPIVRILAMAGEMAGSGERAAIWFKHQPLPGWAGKTSTLR